MAFDSKRLKTFRWMERLSSWNPPKLKEGYNPYRGLILARFGRLYVTNSYILARVDYPEFAHLGDDEWLAIASYETSNGRLHELPTTYTPPVCQKMRDRVFEDFFIAPTALHYDCCQEFNPVLVAECMKPFQVNDITPTFGFQDYKLQFDGHNEDVSISVVMYGVNMNGGN